MKIEERGPEIFICKYCKKAEVAWDENGCDECLKLIKEQDENEKENKMEKNAVVEVKKEASAMVVGSSPADAISMAIANGTNLEQLEKVLELQIKWEKNEAMKAYHVAMAQFKENPPKIEKDRSVGYSTSKGNVAYSHASLGNVVDKITPELSKHGLSASWTTQQNGAVTVTCCITHSLGHTERTTLTAPSDATGSKNSIQAIGSTITYLQRYTLLSALGLATCEQDDDGVKPEVELIGDKELHTIRDLLIAIDSKEESFLKYLGIEKLEDMPKSSYQKALIAIETQRKAKEVQAT